MLLHNVLKNVERGVMSSTNKRVPLCFLQMQANMNALKYQVIRLMRMLVQICQTLDRVPQEVRKLV